MYVSGLCGVGEAIPNAAEQAAQRLWVSFPGLDW